MKTLLSLLVLLAPLAAWPCMNPISESRALAAIALTPGAQAGCVEGEPCYCFDGIDWETAQLADVEESYQEENPEWRRQLEQLERDGHLDDGSTVTTAPPFITRTRTVRKLVEDAAKKAAKDAREAAEEAVKSGIEARKAERAAKAATLKDKTLSAAEQRDAIQALLKEVFGE